MFPMTVVSNELSKQVVVNSRSDEAFDFYEWIEDPTKWSRKVFINQIKAVLKKKDQAIPLNEEHLIATLGVQMEIYVSCWRQIKQDGLVVSFRNKVIGANPHCAIADKALSKVMLLMKDLALSEKLKIIKQTPEDLLIEEIMRGPPGYRR